ncbi:MAG: TRAP transporter substrate-binding protein DctP [Gammaproteobacteria bacterium]
MVLRHILSAAVLVVGLAFSTAPASAATSYTLKFATLAPAGSTWMNLLAAWGKEVKARSHGRLVFKFYPGGVQGDETDVLQKIRFGQLQGAAFTGYGIGHIYSPARVLEVPFLFRNYGEIDYVRHHLMPSFRRGFKQHGFRLLGWMEVGFVHFFSKQPIRSLDDLKKRRIWLWQGDPLGQAFFDASDLAPVPLSITDVFTSLSTGLIDTVYCTPLAAIALQWFTQVSYMTRLPMADGIGALVVSNRFFDRLPPDLQKLLQSTGRETGHKLIEATRKDNRKSLKVLQRQGIKFTLPADHVDPKTLYKIRDKAAATLMASGYIPKAEFQRTKKLLAKYRRSHPADRASDAK